MSREKLFIMFTAWRFERVIKIELCIFAALVELGMGSLNWGRWKWLAAWITSSDLSGSQSHSPSLVSADCFRRNDPGDREQITDRRDIPLQRCRGKPENFIQRLKNAKRNFQKEENKKLPVKINQNARVFKFSTTVHSFWRTQSTNEY